MEFEVNKACTYDFLIIHNWGVTVFEQYNLPITDNILCPWAGQNDNGNDLSDGLYYALIILHNDCGDDLQMYSPVWITSSKMQEQLVDEFEASKNDSEVDDIIEVNITTHASTLTISSESYSPSQIMITSNLGQIIYTGTFNGSFNQNLAAGIYYVVVITESGLTTRQKIVIL